MTKYILFFFISFTLSLLLTPLIRLIAQKLHVLDFPSDRKIHQKPVPLLGGIPIFIAFNATIFLGITFNFEYLRQIYTLEWILIFIAEIIILTVGIFDDVKKVQPSIKFLFQVFAGFLLLIFGLGLTHITNPFTGKLISLGFFSIPITILWVVGITNALNLVDGLDGLAAGVSIIICVTIFGISYIFQNIGIALISIILAGSILGFIRYNFYPAKIFLGDSGSLLLGFLLALLSLKGSSKGATLVSVLAPVLALGLPIMDTLLTMIRRFLKPLHVIDYSPANRKIRVFIPRRFSLFKADKDHIHHRLIKFGFSQRNAVITLYGICLAGCALGFIPIAWRNLNVALFLGSIILASFIGIKSLKYREFNVLENGLLLRLYNISLIKNRFFLVFIDLFFISLSYYLSFIFIIDGFMSEGKALFIKTIPIILVMKIAVFFLSGLYRNKGSVRHITIGDLIYIGKAQIFSSVSSLLVLAAVFGINTFKGILFFIVDFYILATLVIGSRISYRVLEFFSNKRTIDKGKRVIIYGAGRRGFILLEELRENGAESYSVVGFIDDDPKKLGGFFHGIPILGSFEGLDSFYMKNGISVIILSTPKIDREKISQITEACMQRGIELRQFDLKLESISKQ